VHEDQVGQQKRVKWGGKGIYVGGSSWVWRDKEAFVERKGKCLCVRQGKKNEMTYITSTNPESTAAADRKHLVCVYVGGMVFWVQRKR